MSRITTVWIRCRATKTLKHNSKTCCRAGSSSIIGTLSNPLVRSTMKKVSGGIWPATSIMPTARPYRGSVPESISDGNCRSTILPSGCTTRPALPTVTAITRWPTGTSARSRTTMSTTVRSGATGNSTVFRDSKLTSCPLRISSNPSWSGTFLRFVSTISGYPAHS